MWSRERIRPELKTSLFGLLLRTGKKSPWGAGAHTGQTGAHRHTDHTEPVHAQLKAAIRTAPSRVTMIPLCSAVCTLTASSFRLNIAHSSTPQAPGRVGQGASCVVSGGHSPRDTSTSERSSVCQKRLVTASDRDVGTRLMHIHTRQPTYPLQCVVPSPRHVRPRHAGSARCPTQDSPPARLPPRAYLGHRARAPLHPLAHVPSPMPPAGGLEHVHVRTATRALIACLPSPAHHPPYPLGTASLT